MRIELKIDAGCREPKIIVLTDRITDEINAVMQRLSEQTPQVLVGFQNDCAEILDPAQILLCYASSGKTFAVTDHGEYALRLRLYELEERLDKKAFVRISNAEIINLKKVRRFDLSMAGTICVTLSNGTVTYVSRRYVTKIKQVLGI